VTYAPTALAEAHARCNFVIITTSAPAWRIDRVTIAPGTPYEETKAAWRDPLSGPAFVAFHLGYAPGWRDSLSFDHAQGTPVELYGASAALVAARLAARQCPDKHANAVPVDPNRYYAEPTGWICPTCSAKLPPDWNETAPQVGLNLRATK
jgi:rubredoxin